MAFRRKWSISSRACEPANRLAENGHDGRAVVEAVFALYESAGRGRRIAAPFRERGTSPDRPLAGR